MLNSDVSARVIASIAGWYQLHRTHKRLRLRACNDEGEDPNLYSASTRTLMPLSFARVHILARSAYSSRSDAISCGVSACSGPLPGGMEGER